MHRLRDRGAAAIQEKLQQTGYNVSDVTPVGSIMVNPWESELGQTGGTLELTLAIQKDDGAAG